MPSLQLAALERAKTIAGVNVGIDTRQQQKEKDTKALLAAAATAINGLSDALAAREASVRSAAEAAQKKEAETKEKAAEAKAADAARNYAKSKRLSNHDAFLDAAARGDSGNARAFVRFLGVSVDTALNSDGLSALHSAAKRGDAAMVRLLAAELGGNVAIRCSKGRTALLWAAFGGHAAVVRLLAKELNADASDRQPDGWTALHLAALNAHDDVVTVLVRELGVDVDQRSGEACGDTTTPAAVAATLGETPADALLRMLIERAGGSSREGGSTRGRVATLATPLHRAASHGKVTTARLLVELGADVNARCSIGRTPLHLAAISGEAEAARLFIDSNADLNVAQADGWTALHLAAGNGHVAICRALLAAGDRINVSVTEDKGLTPLHLAADKGHTEVVRLFARDGRASTTAQCRLCRNPLHCAALRGEAEVIRILVNEMGADVNAPQSDDRWTALHLAAGNGHTECVRALILEFGARVSVLDVERKTPEVRARDGGHTVIVELLRAAAA